MAKKDFLRGMEAGARPFEEKFLQVERAVNTIGERVNERLEGVRDVVNIMADDLSAMQKKELYDLNTQFDLKQLEEHDKELLLAGLYTLASMNDSEGGLTEHQQSFVRSVQKYVGVKTPQMSVDLSVALENVESITVQKALLQAFMEFLFLENENDTFLDDYEDLFDFFSVKKKDKNTILEQIHTIYRTTGAEGIAEKYGYVPPKLENSADDFDEEDTLNDPSKRGVSYDELFNKRRLSMMAQRTDMAIDFMEISAGEETIIKDKNLSISDLIWIEGKLILENCRIDTTPMGKNYGQNDKGVWQDFETFYLMDGILIMKDCEFIKMPIPQHFYQEALSGGLSMSFLSNTHGCAIGIQGNGNSRIFAENCYFDKIHKFCGSDYNVGRPDSFVFKRCLFDNGFETFIACFKFLKLEQCTVKNHIKNFLSFIDFPTLIRCVFESDNDAPAHWTLYERNAPILGNGVADIIDCTFENCRWENN